MRKTLPELAVHGGDVIQVSNMIGVSVDGISDFSTNSNPLGPPKSVVKAIRQGIKLIPYYPEQSYKKLRRLVAETLNERYNLRNYITEENVAVGNGATELIYVITRLFCESKNVVIPQPTFSEYERAVKLSEGKVHYIKPKEWRIELDLCLNEVKKANCLFICNPNNPTSQLFSKDKILKILEVASKNKVIVVVDESFIEFTKEGMKNSLISEVKKYHNLIVLRSLTKIYSLIGLRIGYLVSNPDFVRMVIKANYSWNVNILAEEAAKAALKDEEYIIKTQRLIEKEGEYLYEKMANIPKIKPIKPHANFMLIELNNGIDSLALKYKLLKERVLVRDCSSFPFLNRRFIRVSVRKRKENSKLVSVLGKSLI